MTAHEIDNMASRESLSEAQISEINEINTKKATNFGLVVFQGKVLFLSILPLNFTREAELVTLTRNNCQLPNLFTTFKIQHKNTKIVIFYFTDSLVGICRVYANTIIHLSVGVKPSILTSPHSRLGEYLGVFTSTSVNNCPLFLLTIIEYILKRVKYFSIAGVLCSQ